MMNDDFLKHQAPGAPENYEVRVEHVRAFDGVSIPVRVYGCDARGTPVVLSHGLQSHSGWFVQSCAFLAARGFPVYALDRRGSGMSEEARGDCKDFQTMIADVRAVALHAGSTHGMKKVHVFGHCFGAMPAAAFACAHPEMTKTLVLATPGIFTQNDLSPREKWQVVRGQITKQKIVLPAPLPPEVFSELPQYIEFIRRDDWMLQAMTTRLFWQVQQMRKFIARHAFRLTMPSLLLYAGQDTICDNARNKKFFASLPSPHKLQIKYSRTRHVLEFGPQKEEAFCDLQYWLERYQ